MPKDYRFIRQIDRKTGELPDKITLILPSNHAWLVVKQLITQLEMCNDKVEIELYGRMKAESEPD